MHIGDDDDVNVCDDDLYEYNKSNLIKMNQQEATLDVTISNQLVHIETITVVVSGGGAKEITDDYGTLQLDVEYTPADVDESFKTITWSVSDPSYAAHVSVDENGLAQALNNHGGAGIKATSSDPNGKANTVSISISNQTERVGYMNLVVDDGSEPEIDENQGDLRLDSQADPYENFTVSWTVDDPNLASISSADGWGKTANLSARADGVVNAISYWEDPTVEGRIVSETIALTISNQEATSLADNSLLNNSTYMYPNPVSSNDLSLKGVHVVSDSYVEKIQVYGSNGQLISEFSNKTALMNEKYDKGVYIVKWSFVGGSFISKKLSVE